MQIVLLGELTPLNFKPLVMLKQVVEAGFNTVHEEASGRKIDLNTHLMPIPYNNFLMKVVGESMVDFNIFSGDEVIIDASLQPKNNDFVVLTLNGEFTLKQMVVKDNHLFLRAGNPAYKNLIPADDAEIWGVVTSVIRKLKHTK